jgi:hypothetical protein
MEERERRSKGRKKRMKGKENETAYETYGG